MRVPTSPAGEEHRNRGGFRRSGWGSQAQPPSGQFWGEAETGAGRALQPWVWVQREKRKRLRQREQGSPALGARFPAGCV